MVRLKLTTAEVYATTYGARLQDSDSPPGPDQNCNGFQLRYPSTAAGKSGLAQAVAFLRHLTILRLPEDSQHGQKFTRRLVQYLVQIKLIIYLRLKGLNDH